MPKLSDIIVDDKKEINGTWLPYDDGEVLVARLYNPRFNEFYAAEARKYGRKLRSDTKLQEEVMRLAMSKFVLLNWRGFRDEKDKDIKYTAEVGYQWLKASRELRNRITEMALDFENYRSDEVEKDLGNSKSS